MFISNEMVNEEGKVENGDNGDKFAIVGLAGGIAIMVAFIVAFGASKFFVSCLVVNKEC